MCRSASSTAGRSTPSEPAKSRFPATATPRKAFSAMLLSISTQPLRQNTFRPSHAFSRYAKRSARFSDATVFSSESVSVTVTASVAQLWLFLPPDAPPLHLPLRQTAHQTLQGFRGDVGGHFSGCKSPSGMSICTLSSCRIQGQMLQHCLNTPNWPGDSVEDAFPGLHGR